VRALTVEPGVADSTRIDDLAEPSPKDGAILVEGVAVGLCGTDARIIEGGFGAAPLGSERLILGHESLGRVLETPSGTGVSVGDLVASVVRIPGHPPCASCVGGEWDMCLDGVHVERGITGSHGFAAERWRVDPKFAVRIPAGLETVGVLVEPASVVAKAWAHVEVVSSRAMMATAPRVLVTGAGTIGLLAALLGRQRGLHVDVFDRVIDGPKPGLVEALGCEYLTEDLEAAAAEADIVLECTGASEVAARLLPSARPNSTVCLIGVPNVAAGPTLDPAAFVTKLVRDNVLVFGTVNANLSHWVLGGAALAQADPEVLSALITRRVTLDHWQEALPRRSDDVKVVIDL
jgi:threonine dehydrogenase-like Zn-dependent dehydrogenase